MAEMFRTSALRTPPKKVDNKANVIFGAKVIQAGDVNDSRPFTIDQETLQSVADAINGPNKGVKARFTHPNMCSDGLGRHLGRWKNARVEGDAVFADLHIADAAFDTPSGDLGSYVLNLAEEDPEAFGVSIATTLSQDMQAALDEVGEGERVPFRFAKLHAADIVDEPAATRGGLFDMTDTDVASAASWFLSNHYKNSSPVEVFGRFVSLLSSHYERDIMPELSEAIVGQANVEPAEDGVANSDAVFSVERMREDARPFVEAFGDAGASWYLEGRDLLSCYQEVAETQRGRIEDLENQVAELQAIVEAAELASGEQEPLSQPTDDVKDELRNLVRR